MARVDTDGYRDDLPRVDAAPAGRTTHSPTVYVVDDDAGVGLDGIYSGFGATADGADRFVTDTLGQGRVIGFSVRF